MCETYDIQAYITELNIFHGRDKSRFSYFLTYKIYFENFIKCNFDHIYSVSLLSPRLSLPPIHDCCFLFNSLLF